MRRLRSWAGDRRGIVAVEFALIVPFLLALLLGLFEVSSLVRVSLKLSHAANTLAKVVAQQTPSDGNTYAVTKANLADFCTGSGYELAPFAAPKLAASIVSVTATQTGGTPTKDWENDTACGSQGAVYASTAISLASGTTASGGSYALTPNLNDSAIVVRVSYAYTPVLHYLLGSSWTLTQTAFDRPRQGSTVVCKDC